MSAQVLDPRFDREPACWPDLIARAGLRADWAWPVLAVQAWAARVPQLITLLPGDRGPAGVVAAGWVGPRTRRHRFLGPRRAGGLGALDVRAPGTSAVPGWWFDTDDGDGGVGRLLAEYVPAMRRALGPGLGAALIRQVPDPALPLFSRRRALLRPTEPLSHLDLSAVDGRDAWLQTLSRKRRKSLLAMFDAVEGDPTVAVRCGPAAALDPVAVAGLLRINQESHRDVPIVPLPQFTGYLAALFARPDVVAVDYTDTRDGSLLAVAVVLDHPTLPVARLWSARPPHEGGRPHLYFHLYGELVRWATAAGRPRVMLGKKMAELKESMGAVATPQHAAALPLLGLRAKGAP